MNVIFKYKCWNCGEIQIRDLQNGAVLLNTKAIPSILQCKYCKETNIFDTRTILPGGVFKGEAEKLNNKELKSEVKDSNLYRTLVSIEEMLGDLKLSDIPANGAVKLFSSVKDIHKDVTDIISQLNKQ